MADEAGSLTVYPTLKRHQTWPSLRCIGTGTMRTVLTLDHFTKPPRPPRGGDSVAAKSSALATGETPK